MKKKCFVFDFFLNIIFTVFVCLLLLNLCILLSLVGVAVDSDDLVVFLLSSYQVIAQNYIFRDSVYVVYEIFNFRAPLDT